MQFYIHHRDAESANDDSTVYIYSALTSIDVDA